MVGTVGFRDHLHDAAVLVDDVVARHTAFRAAEPVFRRLPVVHAGIMQQQYLDLRINRTGSEIDGWADMVHQC